VRQKKTGKPVWFELTEQTCESIDVYLGYRQQEAERISIHRALRQPYVALHRPLLLRGSNSDKLWISTRSTPMVDNTVYYRVTHTTKRLIGKPINPHLFRDCVATFIAEQIPEEVEIIARILGHATLATGEEHYNHAGMLSAQARCLEALARLRHRADHPPQQPST
jgi:integrase